MTAALMLATGCGGPPSDLPNLANVTGKLEFRGQPVSGAEVRFIPVEGEGGLSEATTDDLGNFELSYNAEKMGAVIGSHKVKVTVYGERGPSENGMPGPPLAPPKEFDLGAHEVAADGSAISLEIPGA